MGAKESSTRYSRKPALDLFFLSILSFSSLLGWAGEAKNDQEKKPNKETPKPKRGVQMEYGPFLSYSVRSATKPKDENIACKGIAIKLGKNNEASICFDADLMRFSAGWTGGFLDLAKTNIGDLKGTDPATIQGALKFSTAIAPGWAKNESFSDPRVAAQGPLHAAWAHYKGLFLNGDKVVLSYTVGDVDVLELPDVIAKDGQDVFTRTIRVGKSAAPMSVLICDVPQAVSVPSEGVAQKGMAALENGSVTAALIIGETQGAALAILDNSRIVLRLPALIAATTFKIAIWNGTRTDLSKFVGLIKDDRNPGRDLVDMCKGGPTHWPPLVTKGTLGAESGPYVADTLTLPEDNPWNAWMRVSALDFFSDGRAAVSTLNGDVWIVSGIDSQLENLSWKRIAVGLYEPLGLKIVKDTIYVLGRDQITRLHDLNNDGEADYYENFNNDSITSPIYHAFGFDLQTDREGNFYYMKGGNQVLHDLPFHSAMLKVSADGGKLEVFATGLRAPNGMGIGPNDEIVCGDNQGHWISSSKINLVKPGGFYGYMGDPRRADPKHLPPTHDGYDAPICFVPYAWDNSSGGQVYVEGDKWGPFKGHMLHLSYGKSCLFHVMTENVDGQAQGGVFRMPLTFASGIMRARFNPHDGQLYVCGLKGWQTNASRDGILSRVRYTGKPVNMPFELHIVHDGVQIAFTSALDATAASDVQSYEVEQWNYAWTKEYNAPELSVANPEKKGHDPVTIQSVKLSPDHKTVTLVIPDIKPVMQMVIKYKIQTADGTPLSGAIGNTINKVP